MKSLNIIQFTDVHFFTDPSKTLLNINTFESFSQVLNAAMSNGWPPDLVLLTGDLSQDGSSESYSRLQGVLKTLGVKVYCLPGNHDNAAVMKSTLPCENVVVEKHLQIGNWNIIMMDTSIPKSNAGRFKKEELAFLDQILKDHPANHALISFHHSPVDIGSGWLDTMIIDNSREFFEIVDRYPQVKGILFGHIHQEFDVRRNGIRLLSTPSCGLQFKPKSDLFKVDVAAPGYRVLELGGDGTLQTRVARLKNSPFKPDLKSKGY